MARKATQRPPSGDRILDAALALAAAMPWRDVTMEKIAAEERGLVLVTGTAGCMDNADCDTFSAAAVRPRWPA